MEKQSLATTGLILRDRPSPLTLGWESEQSNGCSGKVKWFIYLLVNELAESLALARNWCLFTHFWSSYDLVVE